MNCCLFDLSDRQKCTRGLTLTEFMVAMGIAALVLTAAGVFSIYGARSFAVIGNYADLEQANRNGVDVITREVRQATFVTAAETNLPIKWIALTNAVQGHMIRFTWDSTARTVTFKKTGYATQTILTGCDWWDFSLYQRTPILLATNILFYPATSLSACKLVNMSWKCSRSALGHKLNAESVQTAQVVLRNKH